MSAPAARERSAAPGARVPRAPSPAVPLSRCAPARLRRGQLQVGDGVSNRTQDLYVPTPLTSLPLSPVTNTKVVVAAAAAGGAHTLISTAEGDVYAVGANDHGQLGVGDLFDRPTFTLVASFRDAPGALFNGVEYRVSMGKQNVLQVMAGDASSAAITDQGKLFMWGADNKGQLGLGCAPQPEKSMLASWDDTSNFQEPPRPGGTGANQVPSVGRGSKRLIDADTLINCYPSRRQSVPRLVEALAHTYVHKVVMSKTFSVALTHMCGAERFAEGVCLPRRITEYVSVPVLSRIQSSAEGAGVEVMLHGAGVEECICGQLYMWGNNEFGQLGQGDVTARFTPTLVEELNDLGIHIMDVALGEFHVVGLSTSGNVYTWGYNANGQLGTWDTLNRAYPVRVKKREPGMLYVSAVAAGAYHSIAVSDRGDLYSFGSNRNGQLGNDLSDFQVSRAPRALCRVACTCACRACTQRFTW